MPRFDLLAARRPRAARRRLQPRGSGRGGFGGASQPNHETCATGRPVVLGLHRGRGGAMSGNRKLVAILAADVVGFSRLAGADEDRTLARLRALRSDLIDPTISVNKGRVVKRTGDGALVEFRSVVDAVRCAIEVQNAMVERNAGVS